MSMPPATLAAYKDHGRPAPTLERDLDEAALRGDHPFELRLHRPPRALEYGALRKAAFEYGLRLGFDRLVEIMALKSL